MSNEHLPVDHPWAGHGLSQQVLAGLNRFNRHQITRTWLRRLSDAVIYVAGAMLAFIVAIDAYVLLRTM